MHRLQLYLPDEQMRFLKERARQMRVSIAALIRELVEREERAAQKPITEDPIGEVVGIGHSADKATTKVDEIVYTQDWYERPPQTGRAARRQAKSKGGR